MADEEIEQYKKCLLRHQFGSGQEQPWSQSYFAGRRAQRGFGWGIKSAMRFRQNLFRAFPAIVKRLKTRLAKKLVEGGTDILLHNKDPKEVFMSRGKELLGSYLQDGSKHIAQKAEQLRQQLGSGRRPRKRKILALEEYGGRTKRTRKSGR